VDYRMKCIKPISAALILLAAGAAFAATAITFTQATATLATPTLGAASVTITSMQDDTLTSLSSPCCTAVELHSMTMKNDMMQMRKLDSLAVKAGAPVTIGQHSGGMDSMHLMLIGVQQPLKPGQQFPITFHFTKQGAQSTSFTVSERGAKTTMGGAAAMQH